MAKNHKNNSLSSAKFDLEKQKLNLLQADTYFNESKNYFPSDLSKAKEMIEKAIEFSPNNKDYLSIHEEINRLLDIRSSNPNMLSYYYKELIDFLESKMDVKLIISDKISFVLTSKPIIEKDPIYQFNYKKSSLFLVEEKNGECTLSAVELRVLDSGESLERILMKVPVWRGISVDEFTKLGSN